METKLIALILGVALVLATATAILAMMPGSAFAAHQTNDKEQTDAGVNGGNGVNDGPLVFTFNQYGNPERAVNILTPSDPSSVGSYNDLSFIVVALFAVIFLPSHYHNQNGYLAF